jgi:cell wall-associated NlpC family hydrolase
MTGHVPETLDPRLNAFRLDLADARLRGRVTAARFAEGDLRQVRGAAAPVRRHPSHDAPLDTEALTGEVCRVFEVARGWAWGQLERDGYVGHLPIACLSGEVVAATHRVTALATPVFPAPDIKSPPWFMAGLGAELAISGSDGRFARLATGGYAVSAHLAPLGPHGPDLAVGPQPAGPCSTGPDAAGPSFVDVAERFLGTPYLWGGKTRAGLDCSGLVQTALAAVGHAAPRDSDMQQARLGAPLPLPLSRLAEEGTDNGLRRGDLLFWRGHVAIAAGTDALLHANAHHMAVVVEPLAAAVRRIAEAGSPLLEVRRFVGPAPPLTGPREPA